ncbi:MAG: glycine cleavage system aminomethyltransferase GcvT [Oscillospiraceae bacterium]|jgi:aminomethyltransferase|nr:glycine cleavage system aminomethyltransferase GcvT [Oscillospiraceae bacterium]
MRTPLYHEHLAAGARMTDYHGWELPAQYGGILSEHAAVRQRAGIFDVSHMGEILVSGTGALGFLQILLTHDVRRLETKPWVYSPMCGTDGGTVDDVIVCRYDGGFLLCVNAANTEKDFSWIRQNAPSDVTVENISERFAQIAVQGPDAFTLLEKADLSAVLLQSNTGYTGERGCELYVAPGDAPKLWRELTAAGAVPCGLGARDLLRTEAGLPLYGHELSEDISPLEAGLGRFVCFDKGDFIGRDALLRLRDSPSRRRLIGLTMQGRAIPRPGYAVLGDGIPCGAVTSGGVAPALGCNVAMAFVTSEAERYTIVIRGKEEPAVLAELPFYRRRK